jgi:hypothetical protein
MAFRSGESNEKESDRVRELEGHLTGWPSVSLSSSPHIDEMQSVRLQSSHIKVNFQNRLLGFLLKRYKKDQAEYEENR